MMIRKAKEEDLENNLLDIYIQGFRFHYNGRPDVFSNKSDEELKSSLLKELKELNFLVLEDSSIKGYITYHIKDKHDKILWVDQLIIDESCRGKGYGKKLMDEVEKIAKEENCKRLGLDCWTFNNNTIDMYKHIGFKEQRVIFEKDV